MLPVAVVDRQVARQPAVPFLGVLERHAASPLTAEGLDEPFGLFVRLGREGPGLVRMCRSPMVRQALANALET